jgi:hypothetical protein
MSRNRFASRFLRILLFVAIPALAAAQNNLFTTIWLSPVGSSAAGNCNRRL